MERIIGRQEEIEIFQKAVDSGKAELMAFYGRRRIGKTFIVRHFFEPKSIFFEVCGLKDGSMEDQLSIFSRVFQKTFPREVPLLPLPDWQYAFEMLTAELKKISESKIITLFFDELSWIATPKSGFLQQLDHYWNSEWSKLSNVKVVLCGSAASWMLEKLVYAKGGLHNRLTRVVLLRPLDLSETRAYLEDRNIKCDEKQILELYMVLGGIPYYLNQVEKGFSAAQNVNRICFRKNGILYDEFSKLFSSLFKHSTNHEKIIREIAKSRQGISRNSLIEKTGIPSGSGLNKYLDELEETDFIASFVPYQKNKKDIYYRVVDEYSYFYLKWIKNAPKGIFAKSDHNYWDKKAQSQSWKSWAGYAFEGICIKHSLQIKKKLQIDKIPAEVASWRCVSHGKSGEKGAQIDLLFDRGDGIVSICEIKHCEKEFEIDKSYAEELKNKMIVFQENTKGKKKHLFLVMVTTFGVKKNVYSDELVTNEVVLADLFST
ncbi:MAG: ATP-binding protein [Pseudomonadota bacterium]